MSNEADTSSSSARGPNEGAQAEFPSAAAAEVAPPKAAAAPLSSASARPDDACAHHSLNLMNLTLMDPARWGWTAAGGVTDLLPPHERARRREAKRSFIFTKHRSEVDASRASNSANSDSQNSHARRSFWMQDGQGSQVPPENQVDSASQGAISKKPRAGAGKKRKGSFTARDSGHKSKSQKGSKPIRFSGLWGDSVLDMYTYHRGREGLELRDVGTGDILCDVDATDTSYGTDAPNLVAHVTVEFTLDEPVPEGESGARKFRQVVSWDLGNPSTAPPIVFATDVAEQFGLSYKQTLDLSESIERQLNSWLRNHCGHSQPLVLKDAAGLNRDPPASAIYSLYGGVVGNSKGGMPLPDLPAKKKTSAKQSMRGSLSHATSSIPLTAAELAKGDDAEDKEDAKRAAVGKATSKRCKATTVEDVYLQEVRRRLREESFVQIKSIQSQDPPEEGQSPRDIQCHFCQERVDTRATLACNYAHAFCGAHQPEARQVLPNSETAQPRIPEYCLVCALECTCKACSRRLTAVACLFKSKCTDQGVGATEATFHNLLEASRDIEAASIGATRPAGKRKNFEATAMRVVPKVPPSEFPRELCNGADLDPGTESDYLAVYTEAGAAAMPDSAISAPRTGDDGSTPTAPPPQEDGSIDYCIKCGKHGHLLCCDFCPRAFHSSCVESDGEDDQSNSPWQCPSCKKEQLGLPEETLDGSKYLQRITLEYQSRSGKGEVSVEDLTKLKSIAILREMLDFLMNFSFGYVFKDPVDPDIVPAYRETITNPMDLGTISSRIDDGSYFSTQGGGELDTLVSAIVGDVELVWRNCFTFNFPGSAIYRMAEVQRKAAVRVLTNSLDASVVATLVGVVEIAAPSSNRSEQLQTGVGHSETAARTQVKPKSPQKSRHKISVPAKGAQSRRPIAVLDPDTGRIVKIYSSLQAACAAVDLFLGLKYECERDFGQEIYPKLRVLVKDAAKDASSLLFGYRWLWLDDLRGRKVSFKKPSSNVRRSNGAARARPNNGENRTTQEPKSRQLKKSHSSVYGSPDVSPWNQNLAGEEGAVAKDLAVTRRDAVSGEVLAEFKSVDEAYKDWLSVLDGTTASAPDTKTLHDFKSSYLDRDKPVAGAVWKSYNWHQSHVTNSPKRLPPESVEYLKAWMTSTQHIDHPYPTEEEKTEIMAATGLELKQVANWFVNQRKRYWRAGRCVNGAAAVRVDASGTTGCGSGAIPPHDDGTNPSLTESSTASSPNDPRVSPVAKIFLPLSAEDIDSYEVVAGPETHNLLH